MTHFKKAYVKNLQNTTLYFQGKGILANVMPRKNFKTLKKNKLSLQEVAILYNLADRLQSKQRAVNHASLCSITKAERDGFALVYR